MSASHCETAQVRLYDLLFTIKNTADVGENEDYKDYLNPNSLTVLEGCKLEQAMQEVQPGERFQFVRNGYFCKDTKYTNTYNRIVTLKDSYNCLLYTSRCV